MRTEVFFALALLASPALAQPSCGPTPEVAAELLRQFQERRTATGEMQPGGVLVIYATRDGSTWTAIREMPDVVSCFLSAGEKWRQVIVGRGA